MEEQIGTLVVSEEAQRATELHMEILASGKLAAEAMVDFMAKLKEMRDTALYKELGFETFDDYVTEKVNLRARQAYNYINAYENLGSQLVEENAGLGIKKLSLLAKVAPLDRAEFMEDNDLDGMTAEEMAAKVKEVNGLNEQVSFLNHALDIANEKAKQAEEALADSVAAQDEKEGEEAPEVDMEALRAEVEQELRATIEGEYAEAEAKAAEKARKEGAKEAKAKAVADMEKKLEEAKQAAAEEAKKQAEEAVAAQLAEEAEKRAAEEARAEKLAKELQLAKSTDTMEFSLLFRQFQQNFRDMLAKADAVEAEEGAKLRAALAAALEKMAGTVAQAKEG